MLGSTVRQTQVPVGGLGAGPPLSSLLSSLLPTQASPALPGMAPHRGLHTLLLCVITEPPILPLALITPISTMRRWGRRVRLWLPHQPGTHSLRSANYPCSAALGEGPGGGPRGRRVAGRQAALSHDPGATPPPVAPEAPFPSYPDSPSLHKPESQELLAPLILPRLLWAGRLQVSASPWAPLLK